MDMHDPAADSTTTGETEVVQRPVEDGLDTILLKDMPSDKLKNVIYSRGCAEMIALEFNFKNEEMDKLRLQRAGGGQPQDSFIQMLIGERDLTISAVKEALNDSGLWQALEVLNNVNVGGRTLFHQLEEYEVKDMYPYLIEKAHVPLIPSWKTLAHKLGYSAEIEGIAATIQAGHRYNDAEGLFSFLIKQNITVRDLKQKLYNIHEKNGSIKIIIDAFESMVNEYLKKLKSKQN